MPSHKRPLIPDPDSGGAIDKLIAGVARYTAGWNEATGAIKKTTKASREAKEALSGVADMVGEASPALGGLIHAFGSPLQGTLKVGTYLIKSTIEGINKMLESIGEDVSFQKLTDVFLRQKRAFEDAATAAQLYDKNLRAIAQRTDTPTEAADKKIRGLKEEQAAQERIADAKKNAERVHAETSEVNPVERIRKLAEIEDKYAAQKLARDKAATQAELQAKRDALKGEEQLQAELDARIKSGREKQKKLGTIATMDSIEAADRENLRRTEELMGKKEGRHDDLKDKGWKGRGTPEQTEMNYLGQQVEQGQGLLDKLRKKVAADERVLPKRRQDAALTQADITDAEQKKLESVTRQNVRRRELEEAEKDAKSKAENDATVEAINKSARAEAAKAAAKVAKDLPGAAASLGEAPLTHYQIPPTAIEKMGFIFGNGMVSDHAATTASNTTKMVAQLGTLIGVASGGKAAAATLTNGHAQ